MYQHPLVLFFLCLTFSCLGQSPLHYAKVQIHLSEDLDLQTLAGAGIAIDHVHKNESHAIDFVLDEIDLEKLQSLQVDYEVLIPDMKAYYAEILSDEPPSSFTGQCGLEHYDFGNMGGYHTYGEVISHIQLMETMFPELVKISEIGESVEGRLVYAVKISDKVEEKEAEEGVVFYDALTHAREPMSLESLLYYMWWLLENYGTDAEATYLVNNRELHFVPVVNPDGYVYNETIAPAGGGLWRKNRKDNGNGCVGVDINRNYAYNWGDLGGASDDPCSDVYHGEGAFSEPETRNIRDFVAEIQPSIGFSCHTYGDVILFPNFFLTDFPKYEKYVEFTSEMIPYDYKGYGTGFDMIGYSSSGNTRDFLQSNGMMCWVPEIGHAFWEPSSSICDRVEEFLPSLKYLAWVSGDYIAFHGYSLQQADQLWKGDSLQLVVRLKNKGLRSTTNEVKIIASSPSTALNALHTEVDLGSMAPEEIKDHTSIPLQFVIEEAVTVGEEIPIDLTILQNGVAVGQKRLTFYAGIRQIIFAENAEAALDQWTTNAVSWDTTTIDPYNGSYCISDSRFKSYESNTAVVIVSEIMDLSNTVNPFLEFKAKWSLERWTDNVSLEIQVNGAAWKPLRGMHSVVNPFNGGAWIYGFNQFWIEEHIDLSNFADSDQVRFRFYLRSDGSVNSDGFYFDDFQIVDYQAGINVSTQKPVFTTANVSVYPNPGNGQNTLKIWSAEKESALLQISYPDGQILREEKLSLQVGENSFELNLPPAGLYLLNIQLKESNVSLRLLNL